MKKSFRLMNAAIMVAGLSFTFTACNPETEVRTGVITFEDVVLDSTGFCNSNNGSESFRSDRMTFPIVSTQMSGWVNLSYVSCSNQTDMETVGWTNQYSVYATSGAFGSEKFGLVYGNGAKCSFDESVEVKSMMVNNSTYVYWALKEGWDNDRVTSQFVRKFAAGDSFYVKITGYDSLDVKTGEVDIDLADFRDSKTYICSVWTKVSLEGLGKVKSMKFSFSSSDSGSFGMNTPAYFCIDNIIYDKK